MDKEFVRRILAEFVNNSEDNFIKAEKALKSEVIGLKMFEQPSCFIASATDPLFEVLKSDQGMGEYFTCPKEWLPTAKTVIAIFLPFTKAVKVANSMAEEPAEEWLHARLEGQVYIDKLTAYLRDELLELGYKTVAPSLDERFWSKTKFNPQTAHPDVAYTSNWSERHVAFVCGAGTFGLSKGLITAQGMAGRFTSLITELELPRDRRDYQDVYEYCIECGACIRKCPAQAISLENGKNHQICAQYLEEIKARYAPYYGCGKCQVGVPCGDKIPSKNSK